MTVGTSKNSPVTADLKDIPLKWTFCRVEGSLELGGQTFMRDVGFPDKMLT